MLQTIGKFYAGSIGLALITGIIIGQVIAVKGSTALGSGTLETIEAFQEGWNEANKTNIKNIQEDQGYKMPVSDIAQKSYRNVQIDKDLF